jgi:exonuclease III
MESVTDISVLSWNIRGVHNNNSKRHLKEVIRKYCPTFLAILETHVTYARLSSFWKNNGYTLIHVIEVNGHSGGIWILRNYVATITTIVIDSNQYSVTFRLTPSDVASNCTCVYPSPNPTLRTNFRTITLTLDSLLLALGCL